MTYTNEKGTQPPRFEREAEQSLGAEVESFDTHGGMTPKRAQVLVMFASDPEGPEVEFLGLARS